MRKGFHTEFQLGSKLGAGAFAQVFITRKCGGVDEVLAVKVMDLRMDRQNKPRSETEPVDAKRVASVEIEVKILAKVVASPYSIRMTDSFLDGCFSYIVMEKCDKTLLACLESMPLLNEYTLKKIFRDMLEGLKGIDAMGIVHRDLKPDNFLCVGIDNTVKLCDFGLATTMAAGQVLSGVYGTPPYMCPEMLCGQGYTALADVWSAGVIMYVLLFGQFPYKPAEPSGKAMKAAIKAGVPEPSFTSKNRVEGGGSGISEEGVSFLMRLLSRKPTMRPSAEVALQTPWINDDGASDEVEKAASLRAMLHAARRAGAFDPPRSSKDVDKTGLEALMAELQAKHGTAQKGVAWKGSKSGVQPSRASTDAGSMSASDRSGLSSVDFQVPGSVSHAASGR